MNNILEFSQCANCGACYNICPVNAISVRADTLFYQLHVEEDKCIRCGKCKAVCPVNRPSEGKVPRMAYSMIHKNTKTVRTSSSGGVFSAIAEEILKRGGIVFGAAYADNFRSVKMCSTEQVPLEKLKVSKYVESEVGETFREVKERLERSQEVLYSGAPCQIAGLKRYLGKEYDNLFTCDFSCGGFPSHKIYGEYLDSICQKLGSDTITEVNFRPKIYGWNNHAIRICTENGRQYVRSAGADPYFDCFTGSHAKYSVREYCLECSFGASHSSDIILADFWMHMRISNVRNDNKGISLVIANSEKGEHMMNMLSRRMAVTVLDLNSAGYNLKCNHSNEERRIGRAEFLRKCEKNGFVPVVSHYKLKSHKMFLIKYRIKKALGKTQG